MFVVAYAFSPIDLIPDFIPVIGYLDELLLLPGLIWLALWLTPEVVLVECRERADEWARRAGTKSKSLAGLWVVLAIWTGAGWALWHWVVRPWLSP